MNGPTTLTHVTSGKQRLHHGRLGRTAYHFQPAKNWMSDPSGPLYHNGMYHLFFEYNPHGVLCGTCTLSWGHSVSGDLVNWAFLGTALDPEELPFDAKGCWSGSATTMPDGRPVILYTGRGADDVQVQNMAIPKNPWDPLLREWIRPSYNPVIQRPADVCNPSHEPGPYQKNFRDPSTAWLGRDGLWRIFIAAEIFGEGSVLIYRSADLIRWKRNAAPFFATPDVPVWECPDLFPVKEQGTEGLDTSSPASGGPGVRHVFKLTEDNGADYYVVGWYDDEDDTFKPVEGAWNWRRIDHGHVMARAGKSFFDARKKRRIFWVWAAEMDSRSDNVFLEVNRSDNVAKDWAGVMAFPRTMWLDADGKQLVQWPVEEIEALRRKRVLVVGAEIAPGRLREITGINTLQADVEVLFHIPTLEDAQKLDDPKWLQDPRKCAQECSAGLGGVGPFGLVVMASGDMREQTTVYFRVFEHDGTYKLLMCTDLTRSSTKEGARKPLYAGFVDVDVNKDDRIISLRTLIDHSIIESFGGGGRMCMTARVYPEHVATGATTHLYVFNNGPDAVTVSKLQAWELATASINVPDDSNHSP